MKAFKFCGGDYACPGYTEISFASKDPKNKELVLVNYKNSQGFLMTIPVNYTGYFADQESAINEFKKLINECTI